jgi:hypothetical protein
MADVGTLLFAIAVAATLIYPRIGAAVGVAASLLCLPLYLFFIAPVPFSKIFGPGHEFKVQPEPGFHWETWPIMGFAAIALTIFLCVRGIATGRTANKPALS